MRFANIVVTISLYEGMLLLIPEKSLMMDVIRTSSTPIAEIDINIGKAVEVDVLFRDSSNGIRRVFWKRRRHFERVIIYELRTNVCAKLHDIDIALCVFLLGYLEGEVFSLILLGVLCLCPCYEAETENNEK